MPPPHKLPRIRPEWSLCNFVEQICCLYDLIKVERLDNDQTFTVEEIFV